MTSSDDKFYHAEIIRRVDFAPDLWMFRIRSGGEFKFIPGQYATLGVEAGGKRVERPYSIASSPVEDEIEFFFELVPEGRPHASAAQTSARRPRANAKGAQRTIHAGHTEWAHESSADLDGDGGGSVREHGPHAFQGMERRAF